jgi:hypothetical protein
MRWRHGQYHLNFEIFSSVVWTSIALPFLLCIRNIVDSHPSSFGTYVALVQENVFYYNPLHFTSCDATKYITIQSIIQK